MLLVVVENLLNGNNTRVLITFVALTGCFLVPIKNLGVGTNNKPFSYACAKL